MAQLNINGQQHEVSVEGGYVYLDCTFLGKIERLPMGSWKGTSKHVVGEFNHDHVSWGKRGEVLNFVVERHLAA